jgi:hypothetical protein
MVFQTSLIKITPPTIVSGAKGDPLKGPALFRIPPVIIMLCCVVQLFLQSLRVVGGLEEFQAVSRKTKTMDGCPEYCSNF